MNKNLKFKKNIGLFFSMFVVFSLCMTSVEAATHRKIVSKSISDSMNIWSAYNYNYYFTANAGLTYNDSNGISSISDLSFSGIGYTTGTPSLTASFTPSQISKSNMGSYAVYVVRVTRNIYGYYVDNINYTLTFSPSDYGVPYSIGDEEEMILVDVDVSEPYDIQILNSSIEVPVYDE